MKVLLNQTQELASLDIVIDEASGLCAPRIDALGYRIEGPGGKATFETDEATGGLRLKLALPDIMDIALVIEKDDVKKLKGLMNKDAIKFMVKSLM